MAGIHRVVHPRSRVKYGPLEGFAPDVKAVSGEEGEQSVKVLAFMDPDGEQHIFFMDDQTRERLVTELTGGVVVPPAGARVSG